MTPNPQALAGPPPMEGRDRLFLAVIALAGLGFAGYFAAVVMPALMADPDIPGAFAAGFVNPFASGYSMDTILCWVILSAWILHERKAQGVRHGWIAIPLGLFPGVATAFAVYLALRFGQGRRG
jgi:hypothetical protein